MSRARMAVVLAVVGAAVLVLSALADVIGVGGENDAFGSRQVIGVIVGAVILVVGLALVVAGRRAGPEDLASGR